MNNTSNFNTYTSTQPAGTQTSTGNYLQGLLALGSLGVILGITIFIIWIWSMISMISLNARFKDFYVVYMSKERERTTEAEESPDIHKELVVEPLAHNTEVQLKDNLPSKKPSTLLIIILVASIFALILMTTFFRP